MERKGNNIAEDTFLHWMDVERYMAEFKEGNFNNYEEYQMDVSFPMIFGHRKEFMQSSYSIWSVNELLEYVSSELYPKDNASIAEIEEIVRCFKSMISKYFHMRQDTQLMFSIAINLADNVLDILRAME